MSRSAAVVLVGISGIVAEVLVLREFLNIFLGNELTVGIVLSGWLVSEAAGSWVAERIKSDNRVLILFQIIFSVGAPLAVFSIRLSRYIVGVGFGETFSLPYMALLSFILPFPASFSHGVLFTLFCGPIGSAGKTYILETAGTVMGSILTTYIMLGRFQVYIVIGVAVAATFMSMALLTGPKKIPVLILISIFSLFPLSLVDKLSTELRWSPQKVLDVKNSPYGRVVVAEDRGQKTIFIDGVPSVSMPEPDIQSLESFLYPALLSSPSRENVLVLGGGTGELIKEIAKFPGVKHITLVEIDPKIVEVSLKTAGLETIPKGMLSINIDDARRFLRDATKRGKKYNIIISNIGEPSNLQSVRLLTTHFFRLCKESLKEGGILSFRMPSTFPYMVEEVARVNLSAYRALKEEFQHVSVIPGESENIFLASDRSINLNPTELQAIITENHLKPRFFSLPVISYRLSLRRWFTESLRRVKASPTTDTRPSILYYYLLMWTGEYSPRFEKVLKSIGSFLEKEDGVYFALLCSLLFIALVLSTKSPTAIGSSFIFLTGFQGMIISLSILFMFQVAHGYMYSNIGVLMALFMAGVVAGGGVSEKKKRLLGSKKGVLVLDLLISTFGILLWKVFSLPGWHGAPTGMFYALSFISGGFLGLEFPAVNHLLKEMLGGELPGYLYASDLMGGCLGGILGSCFLLPLIGLGPTILIVSVVKIFVWIPSALLLLTEGPS